MKEVSGDDWPDRSSPLQVLNAIVKTRYDLWQSELNCQRDGAEPTNTVLQYQLDYLNSLLELSREREKAYAK